ncbi:hypothetical protein BDY24DRAFT_383169, partial [Mrakia frigida]|uniref:uncharacterized protein n=1 Tax=Mrakia frigida TaxID=29902 RepID=UPI003FCC17EE
MSYSNDEAIYLQEVIKSSQTRAEAFRKFILRYPARTLQSVDKYLRRHLLPYGGKASKKMRRLRRWTEEEDSKLVQMVASASTEKSIFSICHDFSKMYPSRTVSAVSAHYSGYRGKFEPAVQAIRAGQASSSKKRKSRTRDRLSSDDDEGTRPSKGKDRVQSAVQLLLSQQSSTSANVSPGNGSSFGSPLAPQPPSCTSSSSKEEEHSNARPSSFLERSPLFHQHSSHLHQPYSSHASSSSSKPALANSPTRQPQHTSHSFPSLFSPPKPLSTSPIGTPSPTKPFLSATPNPFSFFNTSSSSSIPSSSTQTSLPPPRSSNEPSSSTLANPLFRVGTKPPNCSSDDPWCHFCSSTDGKWYETFSFGFEDPQDASRIVRKELETCCDCVEFFQKGMEREMVVDEEDEG